MVTLVTMFYKYYGKRTHITVQFISFFWHLRLIIWGALQRHFFMCTSFRAGSTGSAVSGPGFIGTTAVNRRLVGPGFGDPCPKE